MTTPNYNNKKTVQELQQEYDDWAIAISKAQFAKDKGISISDPNFEKIYVQEYKSNPKNFYAVNSSTSNAFYYYGTDTSLRSQLKQYNNELTVKKQTVRFNSFIKDTTTGIGNTATQVANSIANNFADDWNNVEGNLKREWTNLEQAFDGGYKYSEAARTELKEKATLLEEGKMSNEEKIKWIADFNKRYETNISASATANTLISTADKKTGILHMTGNDIADAIKKETQKFSNPSLYWDESKSKTIQRFTSQGISGDIMWNTILGKYNKDDAARKDLEKLSDMVAQGKGNSDEAIALRNKINENYNLNLNDDITANDISKIIASDQKYTYKKKVQQIAADIIEDKLNEQIVKQIESKIGCKLEDWGFEFKDGNIVNTVRDIIRGNKTAFFHQEKFFKKMQKELEEKIDKLIVEKVNSIVDSAAQKITTGIDTVTQTLIDTIDPYRKKLDSISNKLESWLSNPTSAKLTIVEKLDELIKSPIDSIAGTLDRINPLQKFGINLGLGDMFKTITTKFTKGLADKIYTYTKPFVEKALKIVTTVKTQITKLIDSINKIKEQAKQLVEKWKDAIKNAIQEFTGKMINELVKYVKVGLSDLLGGFSF